MVTTAHGGSDPGSSGVGGRAAPPAHDTSATALSARGRGALANGTGAVP
jgi:hypothetical protein